VGSGPASDPRGAGQASPLTAFLDTNVLIRHLTGDPPNQAALATATLSGPGPLLLADLILAECVYVLESFYEVEPKRVAELMRSTRRCSCVRSRSTKPPASTSPRPTSSLQPKPPALARSSPSTARSTASRPSGAANPDPPGPTSLPLGRDLTRLKHSDAKARVVAATGKCWR